MRAPDYGAFVEIGWWKKSDGTIHWFWEAGVDGVIYGGCCPTGSDITYLAGTEPRWRVSHHTDGTWRMYIRTEEAFQFEEMLPGGFPDNVVMFEEGIPMGETGVRGQQTAATDRHFELDYRPCSSGACWDPRSANVVHKDDIAGWHYEYDTGDAYTVKAD